MNKKILFVYGTLKRGEFNDVSLYQPAPRYLGDGWVSGQLFDLGHCPALVLDDNGGPVWGEVFELDASLFADLDRYEAMCGDYVLHELTVHMQGKAITACVYVLSHTPTCEIIPDGRWPLKQGAREQDVFPLGDQAILVDFEQSVIGPRTELVVGFAHTVRSSAHVAVTDVVEAPGSVTVHYRPDLLPRSEKASAYEQMKSFLLKLRCSSISSLGRQHTIPVCYAPEFGVDLPKMASTAGLSVEAVINKHLHESYKVSAQGFLPGFAYLEGVPEQIRLPRLGIPRPRVVAGSVAIAENMCGIYPQDGPGGWNLIGRTPLKLFEPRRSPPSLLLAGDTVSFRQISLDEFQEARGA